MNPDRALEVLLQTAQQLVNSPEPKAQDLAEQVLALDEWLGRGGPLPRRWGDPRTTWASISPTLQYRGRLYRKVR
jgi:hypothetical protein